MFLDNRNNRTVLIKLLNINGFAKTKPQYKGIALICYSNNFLILNIFNSSFVMNSMKELIIFNKISFFNIFVLF